MNVFTSLLGLIFSTFPLLLISRIFPYPYITEEVAKLLFNFSLVENEKKYKTTNLKFSVIGGLLFALAEDVLYMERFVSNGTFYAISTRIILTGGLHAITSIILYSGCKKGGVIGVSAILVAILLHFAYNYVVIRTQLI